MEIRLITMYNADTNAEEVIFTEDLDTPASDYCKTDFTVTFDQVISADLPTEFPLEYTLVKD